MTTHPPDDKETRRLPRVSHEAEQRLAQKIAQREQHEAQRQSHREQWEPQHASQGANPPASGWEDYAREHPPIHAHTPHGDAQRQALIEAAFRLIAESGMEHFRTREVASRVGVNIATLHYYFTTKEDLVRAVVEFMAHEFATRRITAERSGESARAKGPLAELRAELADSLYEIRNYPELFHVLIELSMRARRDPAIREMMQMLHSNWQNHLSGFLTRGVQQGVFRADLDPQVAARMLIDVTKGYTMDIMDNPQGDFPIERIHEEIERWITGYTGACNQTAGG